MSKTNTFCGLLVAESESLERWVNESMPFSIACNGGCDAGSGIDSLASAKAAGWADITFSESLTAWFLGLCPDCRREGESGHQLELFDGATK